MKNQTSADGTIGFDDMGQGPVLVLLHAFPLSRAMWWQQVEALQDAYRVITIDLRGFGDSSGFPGRPSVDQLADDAARVLDEVGVDRAVVGGLSMGGYVSLAFARRHAGRLRGLILADTRAEPDNEEARANRERMIAQASAGTGATIIEGMLPNLMSPATLKERPEVVETVRQLGAAQVSAGIVGALQALRDRPDSRPGLGAIAVPTLVIVGRDDKLTPIAFSEAMVSAIRGARLVVIEGAGHLSNLEQPRAFNAAVRSFLDGLH